MKIFQKKGILSKAIERDAKNMKKILEDIKTNTYERFYLFYGEEKYMISQMKNQLKKALVSEDDTMNYSYFEGKRADAIEIVELAKTLPFFSDHRFLILDETGLGKKSDDTFIEGLKEASDTSVVLFIEDSVDKRSKIYKFLSKEGHAVCFESAGQQYSWNFIRTPENCPDYHFDKGRAWAGSVRAEENRKIRSDDVLCPCKL